MHALPILSSGSWGLVCVNGFLWVCAQAHTSCFAKLAYIARYTVRETHRGNTWLGLPHPEGAYVTIDSYKMQATTQTGARLQLPQFQICKKVADAKGSTGRYVPTVTVEGET